jgi:hypothetical protein
MGSPLRPVRPHIIEFIGLPGAGKTTIVNRLCALNAIYPAIDGDDGHVRFSRSINGWGDSEKSSKKQMLTVMKGMIVVAWITLHPKAFQTIVKYTIFKSEQPMMLALVRLKQFFCCLAHVAWIRIYTRFFAAPVDNIVFDQGVLQAILSLDLGNRRFPAEVLEDICRPDIVIYIDADALVATQRLLTRVVGESRLDRMEANDASNLMVELEKVFALFIETLITERAAEVIIVPSRAEDTPEVVARAITMKLK